MATADRRAFILDVTENLLVEIGNAELTMRKVARAAGISLGNLQYHFAKREDLLLGLLTRFLEPYEERVQQAPNIEKEDVVEALKPMFLDALTAPDFDKCAIIYKEIWAAASHSSEMRDSLNTYYRRLAEFYCGVLAKVSAPNTSPEKIRRAATAMLPIVEGYCVTKDAMDLSLEMIAEDWAKMAALLLR